MAGTIVSMGIAIGPVARMWTRSLYALVNKVPSWDSPITLSDNASTEIEFWSLCFETFNGNHIWPTSPIVNVMSYSDSSDFAWGGGGGYIVQIADHIAKGSFTEVEAGQSSTWRELKGTFYVLASYLKQLQGIVVKHQTDNQNVVRALSNGSKTDLGQELAVDIFKLCIEFNNQLFPEWIPRGNNQWADVVSKDLDRNDYMLHPDIFAVLDVMWGPHSIDRFSSFHTCSVLAVVGQAPSVKLLTLLQFLGQMKTIGYFLLHIWYLGSCNISSLQNVTVHSLFLIGPQHHGGLCWLPMKDLFRLKLLISKLLHKEGIFLSPQCQGCLCSAVTYQVFTS